MSDLLSTRPSTQVTVEPRSTGRKGERGVVIVEFAIVATLFVVLILGIFEIGMAWSDNQVVTQSARNGARVGSQRGVAPDADQSTLQAVAAGLGSGNGTITRVVIYEADINGNMPSACEAATAGYSGSANCNVYGPTELANLSTAGFWGSGTACGSADGNWCSVTDRSDNQLNSDFLGVRVEIERDFLTGFFGAGKQTITEQTVMRIEPGI